MGSSNNGKRKCNSSIDKTAYKKRCGCLKKKANELATLCDSQVALFGYSGDGELFEHATSSMNQILTRFEHSVRFKKGVQVDDGADQMEVNLLREETEMLKQKDKHLLGMDLERMSREELRELEQQLNEGLLCIKDKKEAILVQLLEQSRNQEQQYMKENESLRTKVRQLETLCEQTSYRPRCVEYQLMPMSGFAPGEGLNCGSQMACSTGSGDANDVDTTLRFGPPGSKVCERSQTQHEGTRSNADNFLRLWVGA